MSDKSWLFYDEVSENQVVQFIEQGVGVLAHLTRYTPDNRLVAKSTRLLYDLLPTVMDRRGVFELAELHGMLLVNGKPLSPAGQNVVAVGVFLFILLKHNVRVLRLEQGLEQADFEQLLGRLAKTAPLFEGETPGARHIAIGRSIRLELQTPVGESVEPRAKIERAPTPFHGGPASDPAISLSPRLASRERNLLDESPVRVIVRVGAVALAGAEVFPVDSPEQNVMTSGDEGATLYLARGEHELTVRYGEYEVRHAILIARKEQVFEIDLQAVFD